MKCYKYTKIQLLNCINLKDCFSIQNIKKSLFDKGSTVWPVIRDQRL